MATELDQKIQLSGFLARAYFISSILAVGCFLTYLGFRLIQQSELPSGWLLQGIGSLTAGIAVCLAFRPYGVTLSPSVLTVSGGVRRARAYHRSEIETFENRSDRVFFPSVLAGPLPHEEYRRQIVILFFDKRKPVYLPNADDIDPVNLVERLREWQQKTNLSGRPNGNGPNNR